MARELLGAFPGRSTTSSTTGLSCADMTPRRKPTAAGSPQHPGGPSLRGHLFAHFPRLPPLVVQSVKACHVLTDIEQPTDLERLRALHSVMGPATTKRGTIEDPIYILDSPCVHIGLSKALGSSYR